METIRTSTGEDDVSGAEDVSQGHDIMPLRQRQCFVCSDLDFDTKYTSTASTATWRRSAQECESCALVYRAVNPFLLVSKAQALHQLDEAGDPRFSIFLSESGHLSFQLRGRKSRAETIDRGEICRDEASACPWPSIQPDCFGIRNAEEAASRISQWIMSCEHEHERCHQEPLFAYSKLPTRILEIQGPRQVRLRVTDENERERYACLSHCWGNISVIRTTKLTYSTYLEVVPWKALPSTFKHAIDLTRRLGLRYVWIDSLCIVQDDAVDWRHEGSKMASIYAHSYITLVAAASKDSRYGLYRPEPPALFMEYQMQQKANQAPYSIYVHPRRDHYQFISNKLPLFKRAWFHQERILSGRLVFFGETELYWECRSGLKCECGYMSEPPMTNTLADSKAPGDIKTWHDLVIRHTQLDLTFNTDIFPSLQGIASMWQQQWNHTYLAGLWKEHLVAGLMWHTKSAKPRSTTYIAPSWSWASVQSPVDWWTDLVVTHRNTKVTVVAVSTTPAGQDPKGEVTAGTLVLQGRGIRATLEDPSDGWPQRKIQLCPGGVPSEAIFGQARDSWYPDVILQQNVDVVLFCMVKEKKNVLDYLVLTKATDYTASYERVGLAMSFQEDVRSTFDRYSEEMTIAVV